MARFLVDYIPEHTTYVEVFGGSGALLFAKEPSRVEVYNDLDSGLVNFFRVLRDREKAAELQRLLELTPYSREEYNHARESWEGLETDVERAWAWYLVAMMSFGGKWGAGGWGFDVNGRGTQVQKFKKRVGCFSIFAARLDDVQVENRSWEKMIDLFDTPRSFFYLDPPYSFGSRLCKDKMYAYELDEGAHDEIARRLLALKGRALLSGYDCPQYARLEAAGWVRAEWETLCSAAGRTRASDLQGVGKVKDKQKRLEVLWANYDLYSAKEPSLF
jgi:DNA adenine methylase